MIAACIFDVQLQNLEEKVMKPTVASDLVALSCLQMVRKKVTENLKLELCMLNYSLLSFIIYSIIF